MSETTITQLSADGFDKCAKPEQLPTTGLMDEYLKVKDQVTHSTDPKTYAQADKVERGTGESLIVDGQVRFQTVSIKAADFGLSPETKGEDKLMIFDPKSKITEWNYIGAGRQELRFDRTDESGKNVHVDALLAGTTVLGETIDRGTGRNRTFAMIKFNPDGTAKGAECLERGRTSFSKNFWDSH